MLNMIFRSAYCLYLNTEKVDSRGRLQNIELSKFSQSEQQPSVRRLIPNADWQKEEFVEKFTKRCVPEESCYHKIVMFTTKESLVP